VGRLKVFASLAGIPSSSGKVQQENLQAKKRERDRQKLGGLFT
jgi:hypothetical protein